MAPTFETVERNPKLRRHTHAHVQQVLTTAAVVTAELMVPGALRDVPVAGLGEDVVEQPRGLLSWLFG